MYLTIETFKKIVAAATKKINENGQNFYGWKNSPTFIGGEWHDGESADATVITAGVASSQSEAKLNGAYGERFVMSLGMISALIANGYNIRFVQFNSEPGVPFNAEGWTVIVVETMPIFHIAPWDLAMEDVSEIVELLNDNSTEDVSWKGTNKVGEFKALLDGSLQKGLNLLQIAQTHSFIGKVKATMQPEGRAAATAATLIQLMEVTPEAELKDLVAGWNAVSTIQEGDEDGPIIGRRNTCAEFIKIAEVGTGDLETAKTIWKEWIEHFEKSTDPRHSNMVKTFQRELVEMNNIG